MIAEFTKINIENILFFDIETVTKNAELDINSDEFRLYQRKIRYKSSNGLEEILPTYNETAKHYSQYGGLKMGYNKIVSIGVSFIKNGVLHVKSIDNHDESKLLVDFFNITKHFNFVCGFNIKSFDLPMLCFNASKYFKVHDLVPERFNTSGKKPWNMNYVIDIMELVSGTHYSNMSLSELALSYGIEDPKEGVVNNTNVSTTYWVDEDFDAISHYVKKDTITVAKILHHLMYNSKLINILDKDAKDSTDMAVSIYEKGTITDKVKAKIKSKVEKSNFNDKDKDLLAFILKSLSVRCEFMKEDSLEVRSVKEFEIDNFLKTI